jgi:hypothetical protein
MREIREEHKDLQHMHKSLVVAVSMIAETQKETAEKLHALIETVDRIIRENRKS